MRRLLCVILSIAILFSVPDSVKDAVIHRDMRSVYAVDDEWIGSKMDPSHKYSYDEYFLFAIDKILSSCTVVKPSAREELRQQILKAFKGYNCLGNAGQYIDYHVGTFADKYSSYCSHFKKSYYCHFSYQNNLHFDSDVFCVSQHCANLSYQWDKCFFTEMAGNIVIHQCFYNYMKDFILAWLDSHLPDQTLEDGTVLSEGYEKENGYLGYRTYTSMPYKMISPTMYGNNVAYLEYRNFFAEYENKDHFFLTVTQQGSANLLDENGEKIYPSDSENDFQELTYLNERKGYASFEVFDGNYFLFSSSISPENLAKYPNTKTKSYMFMNGQIYNSLGTLANDVQSGIPLATVHTFHFTDGWYKSLNNGVGTSTSSATYHYDYNHLVDDYTNQDKAFRLFKPYSVTVDKVSVMVSLYDTPMTYYVFYDFDKMQAFLQGLGKVYVLNSNNATADVDVSLDLDYEKLMETMYDSFMAGLQSSGIQASINHMNDSLTHIEDNSTESMEYLKKIYELLQSWQKEYEQNAEQYHEQLDHIAELLEELDIVIDGDTVSGNNQIGTGSDGSTIGDALGRLFGMIFKAIDWLLSKLLSFVTAAISGVIDAISHLVHFNVLKDSPLFVGFYDILPDEVKWLITLFIFIVVVRWVYNKLTDD